MYEQFKKAGFTGRQARKLANDPQLQKHPDPIAFVKFLVNDAKNYHKMKPAEARKHVFGLLTQNIPMRSMKIKPRAPMSGIQRILLQSPLFGPEGLWNEGEALRKLRKKPSN